MKVSSEGKLASINNRIASDGTFSVRQSSSKLESLKLSAISRWDCIDSGEKKLFSKSLL